MLVARLGVHGHTCTLSELINGEDRVDRGVAGRSDRLLDDADDRDRGSPCGERRQVPGQGANHVHQPV